MFKKSCLGSFMIVNILVLTLMLWGAGCSDSTGPANGGKTDTTPPALASVTPADVSHIEVSFNENVDGATAEHRHNYDVHRFGGIFTAEPGPSKHPGEWGDTLDINSAALLSDGKTVLLSVYPEMEDGYVYHLIARNIKDLDGNSMTEPDTMDFIGVANPDNTAPEIVGRSPEHDAPGVGVAQSVLVTFSEPMDAGSVQNAFSWTGPGGNVPFDMQHRERNIFVFIPTSPLDYGSQYTVGFAANTAMDYSSNYLAASSWSFTTTSIPDNTPPTVVSTTPPNGATNVPLDIILRIEFSEPIDPNSAGEEGIMMTPNPGDGILTWTNGGKTLNYDPDAPLLDNTTYSLFILEGAVRDYAGNPLADYYSMTFTTGPALPAGGFSGTISGDPNSVAAADPEGAIVAAFKVNIFTWDGGDDEDPPIAGFTLVDQNGDYEIVYLEDGTYWPVAMLDTDGNGELDFSYGDAFGVYGIDFGSLFGEPEPDSVIITGGNTVHNVDFALFDQSAIWGEVSYGGTIYLNDLENYNYYVGVFDTSTFNPNNPIPDYATEGRNISWRPDFVVNELENGLADGTYFIGAYMDVNSNGTYNPGTDPVGYYEDGGEMVPVTVENGQDAGDILVVLQDPELRARQIADNVRRPRPKTSGIPMHPELRKAFNHIKDIMKEKSRQGAPE